MKEDIVILIPAYNPNSKIYELVQKLRENGFFKIVVVDDGSSKKDFFQSIEGSVTLLHHKSNLGKGRALKTGMAYCIEMYHNIIGIITVDADGQHKIEDVCRIYEAFKENSAGIILGSRNFRKTGIPVKSRIGNIACSKLLKYKIKVKIRDTQTGLRAIPFCLLESFKEIGGEHFEYETNVLIYCCKRNINIQELPIESIYIEKNRSSNYRPIRDSISILKQLYK